MKLAAIINLWDGEELLLGSIKTIKDHVDLLIIVYQVRSNFGEMHRAYDLEERKSTVCGIPAIWENYEPIELGGLLNEQNKRNIGLAIAKREGCTHFLHMDIDEYYEDFASLKQEFIDSQAFGSVCPIYTYFKKPTWRLENLDGYYVPFIHRLLDNTQAGYGFPYSFYCDPTRVINQANVVKLSQPMHHFSWVRMDIERKARNSSAGQHGNKLSGLLKQYWELERDEQLPTVIEDMGGQNLIVVDDIFMIGDVLSTKSGQKRDKNMD